MSMSPSNGPDPNNFHPITIYIRPLLPPVRIYELPRPLGEKWERYEVVKKPSLQDLLSPPPKKYDNFCSKCGRLICFLH